MKTNTFGGIFLMLSIPLVLLTCNTFAEDIIDELHKESAILVSQERYDDALKVFDQILEIDPDNVKALNHKGATLVKMEEFENSLKYFDKALELQPNNTKILKNKAIALTDLMEYEYAISIYETVLEINPNNEWAEEERNFLLLLVDLTKVEEQIDYIIHVSAVVRDSDGRLVSAFENISADFLPSKLTEKFLEENFTMEKTVIINDKKYAKMTDTKVWIEEGWCPQVCGAYSYTHFMRIGMITDVQMIHYLSGYFPSVVVGDNEKVTETWTVFKKID